MTGLSTQLCILLGQMCLFPCLLFARWFPVIQACIQNAVPKEYQALTQTNIKEASNPSLARLTQFCIKFPLYAGYIQQILTSASNCFVTWSLFRTQNCYTCVAASLPHPNVLQYKESKTKTCHVMLHKLSSFASRTAVHKFYNFYRSLYAIGRSSSGRSFDRRIV